MDWSGLLPTGTVTLLLGDVEGSTRLWETQPEQMTAAMARMNHVVSETMANNNIAARLFVSPRTVQTHLTHAYTKLSLSSRVQLVNEAARHI